MRPAVGKSTATTCVLQLASLGWPLVVVVGDDVGLGAEAAL